MTARGAKRGWRGVVLTCLSIAAVLLVGAAIYFGVRLYPWLRGPDETRAAIEARWAKVESWAHVDVTRADNQRSELDAIAATLRSFERPKGGGEVPFVDPTSLSPAQRTALERFERWEQSGAPMANRSCPADAPPGGSALHLFKVGLAALFTAEGAEQLPRVKAVLVLAQRLRQRGAIIDLAVGSELAVKAAAWSQLRNVPLPRELSVYRPRVDEIHATLAREAVCIVDRTEQGDEDRGNRLGIPKRGPPFGIVSLDRERRVYKDFHGRLLEQAHPHRDDWAAIVRVYEDAEKDRPKSVLLDITQIYPSVIGKTGATIDRYDSLVTASR